MKIGIPAFRGEVPKMSSRLLNEGFAASAVNCRLLSGDLTPWKQPTAVSTLTPASTLKSVYKMQTKLTGADVFLRSADDVDWAKGAVAGDTAERIYFTGFRDTPSGAASPAAPKVTNFSKATGGVIHSGQTAGNYPNDWLLLGVPAPSSAPTGTESTVPVGAVTTLEDGVSKTAAPGVWTRDLNDSNISHNDSTMGGSCIKMLHQSRMYLDAAAGNDDGESISIQFRLDDASQYGIIRFGCDALGNGPAIRFKTSATDFAASTTDSSTTTAYFYSGTIDSWGGTPVFTETTAITPSASNRQLSSDPYEPTPVWDYTSRFRADTNFTITITISQDSATSDYQATVIMGNFSKTFTFVPQGSYFGLRTDGTTLFFDSVTTSTVTSSEGATSTTYVYTWINEFGDESAPSPASNIVRISPGLVTTVTGINDPSASEITNYGLSNTGNGTKRLYRAATDASGVTQFLFVADIDYGTTSYVDSIDDSLLGEVIESTDWNTPPSDGHSILSLPNGITMMASKNQIYPSVQNRPHAYPSDYVLVTDFDIVGMAAIDTTVIILTKANPYLVIGSDPSSLSMAKLEFQQGCVSKRSIQTLAGFGVVYASPDGLVAISGNGVQLITKDYFTREQWQALVPSSIFARVHDDKYFFWYDTGSTKGGYIIDFKEGGNLTPIDLSIVSTYDNAITAGYADPLTDTFYFIHSTNKLATWNSSATNMQYTWKSKVYQLPYKANFLCGQLKGSSYGSGVNFKLYGDGSNYFTKNITADGEFVLGLPTHGCNEMQIELVGTATIKTAEVAETMEELA